MARHNALPKVNLACARCGKGHRVTDKVAFAIEMISEYPEIAAEQGFSLVKHEKVEMSSFVGLFEAYGKKMSESMQD